MKKVFILVVIGALLFSMCKKEKKQSMAVVTTDAVSELTATSARIGGAITNDGGSQITKRGLCWAINASPTVADSITDEGTGTSPFTRSLAGLNPNTTYYVRAYAINASGTAYGNEVNFKTNAGLATIKTSAITDIVALSAKGGGEIINDGGASITERGLVYGTSANPTTSNTKVIAGTGTGTFTATLSPLASQQTYYVRAYAINTYGTSYGNQVQFNAASANTISDIEGNVYPYVNVCGKQWMATNLKVTKYKNGDPITDGSAASFNWTTATNGTYAYPNNEIAKKDAYGLYYNGLAMADTRGVCPAGWHVPSDDEWKAAEICAGMTQLEADAAGCRGTIAANLLEGGSTGLNIQKAGYLIVNNPPQYTAFGQEGAYWTSTPRFASFRQRGFNAATCGDPATVLRGNGGAVYSIRCVKD